MSNATFFTLIAKGPVRGGGAATSIIIITPFGEYLMPRTFWEIWVHSDTFDDDVVTSRANTIC